jgi:hypothetical protein
MANCNAETPATSSRMLTAAPFAGSQPTMSVFPAAAACINAIRPAILAFISTPLF